MTADKQPVALSDRSITRRSGLQIAAASILTAGAARSAAAADAASAMTFAIGAPVLIDSTAPYASVPKAMKYWAKQGLDVTIHPTQGATASMQLLMAGRTDVSNGGTSSFYQAAVRVPQIRVISLQAKNIWKIAVLAGSPVKSIMALKGKTIGTQSFSSASYLFGRAAVAASGLDPNKDVKWLAVGVGSQAAQALKRNIVAAYASYEGPTGVIGAILGTKLVNLPTPLDDVPGLSGYATTEKFVNDHPELVVKFLRGIYEGAVFAAANPAAALQIQWQAYPEQRPRGKSLAEAIKATLPAVATRYRLGAVPGPDGLIGDVSISDIQRSIDFLTKYGVIKKRLDASKIAVMKFNKAANEFDAKAVKAAAENWKSA